MNQDKYNLQRFTDAQAYTYQQALSEIKNGKKVSHWIWYIFPQLNGLGHSYNSKYYALSGIEEARAYLDNNILGKRLREMCETLFNLPPESTAKQIFGSVDAMKVKSCMTLFDSICPNDIFNSILLKFYDGSKCRFTLRKYEQLGGQVRGETDLHK